MLIFRSVAVLTILALLTTAACTGPIHTSVRVVTQLDASTIRMRIRAELARRGFRIEPPSTFPSDSDDSPVRIGPDGSIISREHETNHFRTMPKDMSDPPRTLIQLSVYLSQDSIIEVSGRVGRSQYNLSNPEQPYIEWKEITYGNGEFGPFSILEGISLSFPEGRKFYNKFR